MCSSFRAGCSETENELLDAKSITDMSRFKSGELKFQPLHHFGRQINDSDKVDSKERRGFCKTKDPESSMGKAKALSYLKFLKLFLPNLQLAECRQWQIQLLEDNKLPNTKRL